MKNKKYIRINSIRKVEVQYESPVDVTYYPAVEHTATKLFGIVLWKTPNEPHYWLTDTGHHYEYWRFADTTYYRIQDFPKRVFRKACVNIFMDNRDIETYTFETNEEADRFTETLIDWQMLLLT